MPSNLPNNNPLSYLGVKPETPPNVWKAPRAPTSADKKTIGDTWIDTATSTSYELTSYALGVPNWAQISGSAGFVGTLTGDAGGAIAPAAGNITLAGTANQITTIGAGNTITWSLPAAVTAPGSLTTTTSLAATTTVTGGTGVTATTGNVTATNGNVVMSTAGNKLSIATGANASIGTATLVGGTATVATTAVAAGSKIFLTRASIGATGAAATGNLVVGTITAATSFVINAVQAADATALQASDVSTVNWLIIN